MPASRVWSASSITGCVKGRRVLASHRTGLRWMIPVASWAPVLIRCPRKIIGPPTAICSSAPDAIPAFAWLPLSCQQYASGEAVKISADFDEWVRVHGEPLWWAWHKRAGRIEKGWAVREQSRGPLNSHSRFPGSQVPVSPEGEFARRMSAAVVEAFVSNSRAGADARVALARNRSHTPVRQRRNLCASGDAVAEPDG